MKQRTCLFLAVLALLACSSLCPASAQSRAEQRRAARDAASNARAARAAESGSGLQADCSTIAGCSSCSQRTSNAPIRCTKCDEGYSLRSGSCVCAKGYATKDAAGAKMEGCSPCNGGISPGGSAPVCRICPEPSLPSTAGDVCECPAGHMKSGPTKLLSPAFVSMGCKPCNGATYADVPNGKSACKTCKEGFVPNIDKIACVAKTSPEAFTNAVPKLPSLPKLPAKAAAPSKTPSKTPAKTPANTPTTGATTGVSTGTTVQNTAGNSTANDGSGDMPAANSTTNGTSTNTTATSGTPKISLPKPKSLKEIVDASIAKSKADAAAKKENDPIKNLMNSLKQAAADVKAATANGELQDNADKVTAGIESILGQVAAKATSKDDIASQVATGSWNKDISSSTDSLDILQSLMADMLSRSSLASQVQADLYNGLA